MGSKWRKDSFNFNRRHSPFSWWWSHNTEHHLSLFSVEHNQPKLFIVAIVKVVVCLHDVVQYYVLRAKEKKIWEKNNMELLVWTRKLWYFQVEILIVVVESKEFSILSSFPSVWRAMQHSRIGDKNMRKKFLCDMK